VERALGSFGSSLPKPSALSCKYWCLRGLPWKANYLPTQEQFNGKHQQPIIQSGSATMFKTRNKPIKATGLDIYQCDASPVLCAMRSKIMPSSLGYV
jgi:hypothetical protein